MSAKAGKSIAAAMPDASDLVATIDRARKVFADGDLKAAALLSAKAYDEAANIVSYAKRVVASEALLGKARQMQGDALLIEVRVKTAIANMVDAGQAAGDIATKGKKSNVQGSDISTLDDLGLDRRRLSEMRVLRDAEMREPGIAERAIKARLEQGLDPTRANLRVSIGTKSASKEDRGDNLYQTPPVGTQCILKLEKFHAAGEVLGAQFFEPFCGRGAISSVLEAAGHDVLLSDLNDYGVVSAQGECQHVANFLELTRETVIGWNRIVPPFIISNAPYGSSMNACIAHALREFMPEKMALLCNLNVLSGFDDENRNFYMDEYPPARIYVNARRLPMMHRDGWQGNEAESSMNTAWLVWDRNAPDASAEHPYGQTKTIMRIDGAKLLGLSQKEWKAAGLKPCQSSESSLGEASLPREGADGQSALEGGA